MIGYGIDPLAILEMQPGYDDMPVSNEVKEQVLAHCDKVMSGITDVRVTVEFMQGDKALAYVVQEFPFAEGTTLHIPLEKPKITVA